VTEATLVQRSSIAPEHTWNAESVYATPDAWDAEAKALPGALEGVTAYQGHLGDSPDKLVSGFEAFEALIGRLGKLLTYALMAHHVDTTEESAARRYGQAQGLFGQMLGSLGFIDPELLAIGRDKLDGWIKTDARVAVYEHYIDDLFRRQAHVRSTEVEQIMGMLADPFSGPRTTANLLTNADLPFAPAHDSAGNELAMSQGKVDDLLGSPDREVRRTAWESQTDAHLAFKNTLASNLSTSIKQNVFAMRVRQYDSTLEAALFENKLPVEVFHTLIETFKKNLPTWHRYWAVRRKALGVEKLYPYDIWAPLTGEKSSLPYTQAVDMVCAGLAPLGDEYVSTLRRGCLEERWIDIYANQGKTDAQFSAGWRGTHPFILMRYADSLGSMSTLAHELGHSMHSYLSAKTQPRVYTNYSLFVAEVASNFNQAMVRAYLLDHNTDKDFQIGVLEEAMSNFHRYFFIMPTLARFELEMHERIERGEATPASVLNTLMADLFTEGYGGEMAVDRDRVGITWATFGHLYSPFYVYQYATGISAANALAKRILGGDAEAPKKYVEFLKAGSSVYPLDALKIAGVDMASPDTVNEAFSVLSGLVDRLEKLVS